MLILWWENRYKVKLMHATYNCQIWEWPTKAALLVTCYDVLFSVPYSLGLFCAFVLRSNNL